MQHHKTEREFPKLFGVLDLQDAETGEVFSLRPKKKFREKYKELTAQRKGKLNSLFSSVGIDHIEFETGKPYIEALIRFFKMRERRYR